MKNLLIFSIFIFFVNILSAQHFQPDFVGNGQDHMNIYIVTASIGSVDLISGDEIAVFDGDICCGVAILDEPIVYSDYTTHVTINASKADPGQPNGYTEGNTILFKFWDESAQQEYSNVTPEFIDPSTGQTISPMVFAQGASAYVKLTATQINKPPVADAGDDQSVNEGVTVTLDGTGSSDPDGDPITYQWSAPAGITLSSTTASQPTFTAPEVEEDTVFIFSLQVYDEMEYSEISQVQITVKKLANAAILLAESPQFKIYPNPTNGKVNIQLDNINGQKAEIVIFNLLGKIIFQKIYYSSGEYLIDLSEYVKGFYLVKFTTSKKKQIKKLIIIRN
jgi:hypothetical protein